MEPTVEELAASMEGGIHLGTVDRVDDSGSAWVRLPRRKPSAALRIAGVSVEQLRAAHVAGTTVVVAVAGKSKLVVLGVLAVGAASGEAQVDGRKLTLTGEEEVTLKCGKASITLTSAGKVLIKGEYVLSRSSGVNRIKGGAVQIN